MFLGHFGAGFAAKKIEPRPSLGTLFFAAQFIDLLWPVLLVLGIEIVKIEPGNTAFTPLDFFYYPFSHSLLSTVFWGVLIGIVYYLIRKNYKISILLGLLVVSHWILDFLVHRPDLPIFPWDDFKVGLGLWYSVPLTIIVEAGIFGAGIYYYLKSTRAVNKKGVWVLWSLIIFFIIIYMLNISTVPQNTESIGYAGFSQWLLIFWG